jgi:hypothetical protein
MQIQINADHHLESSEARDRWARGVVESSLGHLADHVTRVEAHLGDESAGKAGTPGRRCLMEARLAGRSPIAVTHHAETLDAAVNGAAHKLVRAIEHELGRAAKHDYAARRTPSDDAADFVPSSAPY